MSFAQDTKAALCELPYKRECCSLSMLFGLLRFGGGYRGETLRFSSGNPAVLALTRRQLSAFFQEDTVATETCGRRHALVLNAQQTALLRDAYHDPACTGIGNPEQIFRCPACRGAYLRGVFLAAGSISSPEQGYHLELAVGDAADGMLLAAFLTACDLAPGVARRRGACVLYYKGSTAIEDFLALIGANKSAFQMMDAKIRKDIRNNVNRANNSEIANLKKVVNAAGEQLAAVRTLQHQGRFHLLPPELAQTARLRCENPEATLQELAQMHSPPLTKSGLNHRLRRLVLFAALPKKTENKDKNA